MGLTRGESITKICAKPLKVFYTDKLAVRNKTSTILNEIFPNCANKMTFHLTLFNHSRLKFKEAIISFRATLH